MVLQFVLANPHFTYSLVRDFLAGFRLHREQGLCTSEPIQAPACLSECPVLERLLALQLSPQVIVQPTFSVSVTFAISLSLFGIALGYLLGRFCPVPTLRLCRRRRRAIAEPIASSPAGPSSTASSSSAFERGCWTPAKVKAFKAS